MVGSLLSLSFAVGYVQQDLPSQIESLLNQTALKGASIGVYVENSTGKVIFERDSQRRLLPASNQKLISNLFALSTLGPDYVSETKVWKENGSYYVEALGDPTMTSTRLREAVASLGGKLPTAYLKQLYNPGVHGTWEIDDLPNRYAAPVSALTIDRGSFEVWVDPTGFRQLPRELKIRAWGGESTGTPRARYDYWSGAVTMAGKPPTESKFVEAFALRKPAEAAGRFFADKLQPSTKVFDRAPDLVLKSPALADIAEDCLVRSDNLYAENLLLMAGLKGMTGPIANPYEIATAKCEEFLTKVVGWSGNPARVTDGSGLSRQNLVTARGLVSLLNWSKTQPWYPRFYDALVSPGRGTLGNRLDGSTFRGKTGTLTGVISLSGFVQSIDGDTYTIALVVNNPTGSTATVRSILDSIVRTIEGKKADGTNFATLGPHDTSIANRISYTSSRPSAVYWND